NRLAQILADDQKDGSSPKIGIIAVDPTSPFSGGALLGDRVRMSGLSDSPHIFIRSMASRGALGGIARAADGAALVMDAAGFEIILIETVGAGQSEVEIARLAHTTIVVEAPGLGDDIQAAKAGILEIADILVVNKSDKTGAESAARALESMLRLGEDLREQSEDNSNSVWHVPVIKVSALNGDGIGELAVKVNAHHEYLRGSGEWVTRSEARLKDLLQRLVKESLFEAWNDAENQNRMDEMLALMVKKKRSPYQIVQDLLK
ncbi:MAG: methylmalonyl Co-A mutase-associated GTPase MeaB, partial [Pelolinea sp.]|nr:methylmalonyl Co-A mutase-associated GTPase MeaB [Pelolinea sp.]